MKRVLGVSLGSSKRDFEETVTLMGEEVHIQRMGTDSDVERFRELLQEYDGKVDAFGFGGGDMYVVSAGKRYSWRGPIRLAAHARQTPVADGSGLKNTLERETIRWLQRENVIDFSAGNSLLVSGVDRFGMAEALAEAGGPVIYGDVIFGLGLPVPLRSLPSLARVAKILLPIICRVPQSWVYPTGKKQEEIVPKHTKYYAWADTICGDFHFIRRNMPDSLPDKSIVTNTTTASDVELLRKRGADLLVTTTPELGGRSPGTNILEAVVVALVGKSPEEMAPDDYLQALKAMDWQPRLTRLQEPLDTPAASA